MNLIVPDKNKPIIAQALGFDSFESAIEAVKAMPLNEFGYAEIRNRKAGVFIGITNNKNSYASLICGGGKCGMSQDWAAGFEFLTPRGREIQNGNF